MTVLPPLEFVNLPSKDAVEAMSFVYFASVFQPRGTILYKIFDDGFLTGVNIVTLMGWPTYSK